ncbi:hypothetical protein [Marinithermofilum abyssi]|uniref:hypothetical protein n=1 Tax=Marinithermofilum abyssi TaxID=1571185 RepID=UPI0016691B38|nr:hypothetical protein [Marinithermofilum abyssi]
MTISQETCLFLFTDGTYEDGEVTCEIAGFAVGEARYCCAYAQKTHPGGCVFLLERGLVQSDETQLLEGECLWRVDERFWWAPVRVIPV